MTPSSSMTVVVSGTEWMGSGLGSIESALYRLFTEADNELLIVAYAISGATSLFFDLLLAAVQRGVRVQMLINRFSGQDAVVRRRLTEIHEQVPHLLKLASFDPDSDQADLHAKVIVADRKRALVGSANLSLRGLQGNHELALLIDGAAAAQVGRAIDTLLASASTTML